MNMFSGKGEGPNRESGREVGNVLLFDSAGYSFQVDGPKGV